ncbi:MAG TPA: glycosyltransferase [Pyrinomonadaceae bacterium]|nr:glycosyltransferase [Pyrinomonadaceae bacterium]
MRVLIAVNSIELRGGGVTHVRELATALVARGHTPVVYGAGGGSVASELRLATVPVVSDLEQLAAEPDIIHGHNHLKTMVALLHFPQTPAVYTCHSWLLWQDLPPVHPRIRSYIAVDYTCYDRLVCECGIPEERVSVVLNAVDLRKFKPRGPLPPRPRRALVFGNNASEETYLGAVREACGGAGLSVDVVGAGAGRVAERPEELLGGYDLVFAKARCALEALSVGAAVILCDVVGAGPLVTTGELERLRAYNFGVRTLSNPVRADLLAREIERYDPQDAAEVTRRVRAAAGQDEAVARTIEIYEETIARHAESGRADELEESRAAARYIARLDAEMASHGAASMRMRERVLKVPVVGRLGVRLARALSGRK